MLFVNIALAPDDVKQTVPSFAPLREMHFTLCHIDRKLFRQTTERASTSKRRLSGDQKDAPSHADPARPFLDDVLTILARTTQLVGLCVLGRLSGPNASGDRNEAPS